MTSGDFHFDLTEVPMDLCLKVASCGWENAVAWSEQPKGFVSRLDPLRENILRRPRMLLWWALPDVVPAGVYKLPSKTKVTSLESMIKDWLADQDYGESPDTDGSVSKGWRVYNESWGHIGDNWRAFVAIEPAWLEYGK